MGIIAALIIGLLAGALARLFLPGDDGSGLAVAMGVGVVGALAALAVGRIVGWYQGEGEGPGILGASLGAGMAVTVYRLTRGRA